jgi:hypothetical protein
VSSAASGRDLGHCPRQARRGKLARIGLQLAGLEGRIAMMYGFGHGSGWPVWAAALTWAGMIAVAGLVSWALYIALAGASRRGARRPGPDAAGPGQILDERLARGEIDAAEYQRLADVLAAGRTQRPAGTGSRT